MDLKYFYELQWPASACRDNKNCQHMTKKELIEDATTCLDDYLIEDAKENDETERVKLYNAYKAIINNKNANFNDIKFPILKAIYIDDDQSLIRVNAENQLDPEQNLDF